MKTILVLSLLMTTAAMAEDEIPPVAGSIRCGLDKRAADGAFYELTLDRQKSGQHVLVARIYVAKPMQSGSYVTTLSEPMDCKRTDAIARSVECAGKTQKFSLWDVVRINPNTDAKTSELLALISEPKYRWPFSGDEVKKGPVLDGCVFY